MKKWILIYLLLCIVLFLCACNNEKPREANEIESSDEEKEFVYEVDNPSAFCVDDTGILYSLVNNKNLIKSYDNNGKFIKEYTTQEAIVPFISIFENRLYYIAGDSLYELDLNNGNSTQLIKIELKGDYYAFSGMVAYKDSVYIIQKFVHDDEWADVRYDDNDMYKYEGEKLLCYDKVKNTIEYIDIPNIKLIAKKNVNELLVYAYDDKGGFYFTTYDVMSNEIKKKIYTDMKTKEITFITYDSILDKIICQDSNGLSAPDSDNIAQLAYFYDKGIAIYLGNNLQSVDGFTYCTFNYDGKNKIARLYNPAYIKDNPILKSYVLGGSATLYVPKGYGYRIESKELNYDELATVLLAGDSDYDFVILSSREQLARIMRDIKAYENLNSVEGIRELLDGCYDYIKDATIDDNGNIWMLPLAIDCPLLIYNPKNCENKEIDFNSSIYTYDKFMNDILALYDDESAIYNIPIYYMTHDIIDKYLLDYAIKDNKAIFDTDLFRKYAEIIKKCEEKRMLDSEYFGKHINPHYYPEEENEDIFYSKVIFGMQRGTYLLSEFYKYDYFRAAATPMLEEGKNIKSIADCHMIIVNPKSKKIKWVMDYLGEVCKSLITDKNSLILKDIEYKDNQLMTDIQNVYANAEILFCYPYEIISNDIMAYQSGKKTLDDTIKEIESKMDMYLNE